MKFFLFNSLLFFFFFNGIIVKLGIVVASSIKQEREIENKFHFLVPMQSVSNDRKEISNRFAMDSFNGYRKRNNMRERNKEFLRERGNFRENLVFIE